MKFLFVGAGAVGTYVGGSLAAAGHDVSFVERARTAVLIQQSGLRLHMDGDTRLVRDVRVYTTAREALAAGPHDVTVLALKSFETDAVMADLKECAGPAPLPPVLSLQNGVDNEAAIARHVGEAGVIAGTLTSAIGKPAVGEVIEERRRGVGIAAGHPLAPRVAEALNDARLGARVFPEAAPMKWSKMLTNLIGNATSAILDMPVGALFADDRLYDVEMAVLRECVAVMRGLGLRPVDLPGTPVRALAFGVERVPRFVAKPILQRTLGSARGHKMPSFHIDLQAGRRTEVAWLNGAVARHGASCGVAAPVNRVLTDTLEGLTSGAIEREQFRRRPEALLALL
ncbi:ketopantoate reductase family protein [Nigerium massiliense]|uniref:ketopantoate reductase family protein n=1 Tax=Nigerium massiliense TaxID=1522317 RepID=UPI00058B151D|nr:2-dehydropantoate 2-reductase [Nigerium massiliense]